MAAIPFIDTHVHFYDLRLALRGRQGTLQLDRIVAVDEVHLYADGLVRVVGQRQERVLDQETAVIPAELDLGEEHQAALLQAATAANRVSRTDDKLHARLAGVAAEIEGAVVRSSAGRMGCCAGCGASVAHEPHPQDLGPDPELERPPAPGGLPAGPDRARRHARADDHADLRVELEDKRATKERLVKTGEPAEYIVTVNGEDIFMAFEGNMVTVDGKVYHVGIKPQTGGEAAGSRRR
mgnify:CR=1 FL=1